MPPTVQFAATAAGTLAESTSQADERAQEAEHVLSGGYDGNAIDAYFSGQPLKAAGRLAEVTQRLLSARAAWEDETLPATERGQRVRGQLSQLGPVFAKIAQTLATRPDIVSRDLAKELGLLQDAMTTFDDEVAFATIREEFGVHQSLVAATLTDGQPGIIGQDHAAMHGSAEEPLFAELATTPVAAASLAQVYQGRMPDGTLVAVKVQRPGLLETVAMDFYVLRLLLAGVNKVVGITRSSAIVVAVLDEVGEGLFAEIDFTQEARNIELFRKYYSSKCPNVVVPDVVWGRTTRRVLTTTWLQGRKPRELDAAEKLSLVRLAAPCLSLQLMDNGFVHCDPHEGNMMLLDDGRLGLIDFGLVAQMTTIHQESMASAILNLVTGDYAALVPCFKGMGVLNTDLEDLRRPGVQKPFAQALEEALSGGGGGVEPRTRRVQGSESSRRRAFGQLYEELSGLAFSYYFTLPSYYVLVMRSFVTLEGIAFNGDPDFNMYTTSYPYAFRRMLTPHTVLGRRLLRDALLTPSGRMKLLTLAKRPGTAAKQDGPQSHGPGDAANAIAAALLAPAGRELRRVLRDADSLHLVTDFQSASAAPVRRALAEAAADAMFRAVASKVSREGAAQRERKAGKSASTSPVHLRRRRTCRRLVGRISLRHLRKALRGRPLRTASLMVHFSCQLVLAVSSKLRQSR